MSNPLKLELQAAGGGLQQVLGTKFGIWKHNALQSATISPVYYTSFKYCLGNGSLHKLHANVNTDLNYKLNLSLSTSSCVVQKNREHQAREV